LPILSILQCAQYDYLTETLNCWAVQPLGSTIISAVVSVFVGLVLGWFFYKLAGRALRHEASELSRLSTLSLKALEEGGVARLNRDEHGNIIGIKLVLKGHVDAGSTSQGDMTGGTDKDSHSDSNEPPGSSP
jgi:hypothetical protein